MSNFVSMLLISAEGNAGFFSKLFQSYYNAIIPDKRYMAYLSGLKMTIEISFFAILLGVLIGLIVAVVKVTAKHKKSWIFSIMDFLCNCYINIIRGTPVMVQLLIIYNMIFRSRDTNEIMVGAICFGINSGAYVAEIIRAGIESIDKGQMEAGRSLGFTYIRTMWHIILPQAVKNILPTLGNEFIALIKETSVAGVIAVMDITKAAQYVGSRTWDPLPPLIIAACCYLIMVLGLNKLLQILSRRLGQNDNH